MVDKEALRTRLNEQLAALSSRVERIERELARPLDDDFGEQAVDREADEALDTLEHSALAEIERIRSALARLDSGSYGICANCGEAIASARLDALPAAELCIGCASMKPAVGS